jgi:AraC family transcriptional regulator, transcriptional activator FtrA
MVDAQHRVVSVLVDGMSALEPAVADDFLGDVWQLLDPPGYRYSTCTPVPGLLRIGGFRVRVDAGLGALARAETVLIPGWRDVDLPIEPAVLAALRRAHRRGARLVSFCTGAFVLAEAGLLDGRPATTHWAFAELFRQRYPAVRLDPGVLYVDDGQLLTSAGAAASIDLAVHLIRNDFGAEVANTVARQQVVPPHRRGGQAQYVHSPVAVAPGASDTLSDTLDWALARLHEPLTVAGLAARCSVSPRHFTRLFADCTGTTPHQWLITQRIALARRLLETTEQPVERIAAATGFGTAAALRPHFQRQLATSPLAYRRTFRQHRDPVAG